MKTLCKLALLTCAASLPYLAEASKCDGSQVKIMNQTARTLVVTQVNTDGKSKSQGIKWGDKLAPGKALTLQVTSGKGTRGKVGGSIDLATFDSNDYSPETSQFEVRYKFYPRGKYCNISASKESESNDEQHYVAWNEPRNGSPATMIAFIMPRT